MDYSRELQAAQEVESIIKPKIQLPAEEETAVNKAPAKKKKGPALFQPTVDYRQPGRELHVGRFFICVVVLGVLFFAFSFWIRTPDQPFIHEAPHLKRRAKGPVKAVERNVRGYSVKY